MGRSYRRVSATLALGVAWLCVAGGSARANEKASFDRPGVKPAASASKGDSSAAVVGTQDGCIGEADNSWYCRAHSYLASLAYPWSGYPSFDVLEDYSKRLQKQATGLVRPGVEDVVFPGAASDAASIVKAFSGALGYLNEYQNLWNLANVRADIEPMANDPTDRTRFSEAGSDPGARQPVDSLYVSINQKLRAVAGAKPSEREDELRRLSDILSAVKYLTSCNGILRYTVKTGSVCTTKPPEEEHIEEYIQKVEEPPSSTSRVRLVLNANLLSFNKAVRVLSRVVEYDLEEPTVPVLEQGGRAESSRAVGLLLDSSGSMSRNDPDDLRIQGARLLLDHLPGSARIMGGAFDTEVQALTPGLVRKRESDLETAIAGVGENGDTNITAALERAAAAFDGLQAASTPVVVLFSDGEHNTGPPPTEVVDRFAREEWSVVTVGLSQSVDDEALLEMARRTGGEYFRAWKPGELSNLFDYIGFEISDQSVVTTKTGSVGQGDTESEFFNVDAALEKLKLSLAWPGSDLDLAVTGPNGQTYSARSQAHGATGETYEIIRVSEPAPGRWEAEIHGRRVSQQEEDFQLRVGGASAFDLALEQTGGRPPEVGERVSLRLEPGGPVPAWDSLAADVQVTGPGGRVIRDTMRTLAAGARTLTDVVRPDSVGNYYATVGLSAFGASDSLVFRREQRVSFRAYSAGTFAPTITRVTGGVIRLSDGRSEFESGDRVRILDADGSLRGRATVVSVYDGYSEAELSAEFDAGVAEGMKAIEIEN